MIALSHFSRPKPPPLRIVLAISNILCMNVFDLKQRLVSDYARHTTVDSKERK